MFDLIVRTVARQVAAKKTYDYLNKRDRNKRAGKYPPKTQKPFWRI